MIEALTLEYPKMASKAPKRIVLIDDHAVVRKGLASLINEEADMFVCGEAADESAAREVVATLRPDVAVVDWSLGPREAGELITTLHDNYPEMPVLVLSMHDEVYFVERVLRVGANGYVMKVEATERIIEAIRETAGGNLYFTDRAISALPDELRSNVRQKSRSQNRGCDEPASLLSGGGLDGVSVDPTVKADLVIAPHPDDETIGCGGTMRLVTEGGTPLDVVFMTRGELGHEEGQNITAEQQKALAEARTREAIEACKTLGVRRIYFLDGKDTRLNEQNYLAGDLLSILTANQYRRVFCPWHNDGHDDHKATFSLLRAALGEYEPRLQVWLYEVWTPLPFNVLIPIDNTMETKELAMENYVTQTAQNNYRASLLGLSAYRSVFCPPAKYAEAFYVCGKEEIFSL